MQIPLGPASRFSSTPPPGGKSLRKRPSAAHIRRGLVILDVNARPATTLPLAREAQHKGINKLYVYSRGRTGYLALRLP